MKIKLNIPLKNIDGSLIINENNEPMNLSHVLITALTTAIKSDADEKGEDKLKRWKLGQDIYSNRDGELDITREDSILLEHRVNAVFPHPAIYGNVREIFDGV
jgi:hypothetical protein